VTDGEVVLACLPLPLHLLPCSCIANTRRLFPIEQALRADGTRLLMDGLGHALTLQHEEFEAWRS